MRYDTTTLNCEEPSIDEPAAFEVIVGVDAAVAEVTPSGRAADTDRTCIGEGATARAPRSVDPLR